MPNLMSLVFILAELYAFIQTKMAKLTLLVILIKRTWVKNKTFIKLIK